ncbi:MAG: transporter substrate-binding domain-containing protein [Bacteroidales bacterium]|nr:transporter substrate-binding domain-containing protein [Candidatus Cryptobacteroides equifaecalis]
MQKLLSIAIFFLAAWAPGLYAQTTGVQTGSVVFSVGAEKELPQNPLVFNGTTEMLRALEIGKVDRIMVDSSIILGLGDHLPAVNVAETGLFPYDVAAALKKGNTVLCEEFDSFLAEIKSNGIHQLLLDRWFHEKDVELEIPEAAQGDGEFKVAVSRANYPFSYLDNGRFFGFEPDLARMFAHRIGRKIVFREYEVAAVSAALKAGVIDAALLDIPVTWERSEEVLFTDSYYHDSIIILERSTEASDDGLISEIKRGFQNDVLEQGRYKLILGGLFNTLLMSFLAILLGTIFGGLMAWRCYGRNRKHWRAFLEAFGKLMHGVPLLVILLLMYYVVFAGSSLSALMVAVMTFTIYMTYACCDIFVSSIDSIPEGQMKAAISLGFNEIQGFRYVVFPQALQRILPAYESESISIVKESSIAGFIAVTDLTKAIDVIQSNTFDAFFPLISGALIYFVICMLISRHFRWVLKKISRR